LEIALIAAFGGLCLIIVIVVIVVLVVRRRKNNPRKPKASSIHSDNEMPSLLDMQDAPSTRGLEKSDSIYGPMVTLGAAAAEKNSSKNIYGAAPTMPKKEKEPTIEYSSVAGLASEAVTYEAFPTQADDDDS
jgi:hypothetical protein